MIKIRPAASSDDKQVKELIQAIVQQEFPAEERGFISNDIENVSKSYGSDGEVFYVACDAERIVGTVGIKREDERNALLRRIFVRPEYRGKKIALQLVQQAISFCKDQGYDEIIFKTTSRMQDAIRLCEANGFVRRATIPMGTLDLFKFTIHLDKNKNSYVSQKEKGRKS